MGLDTFSVPFRGGIATCAPVSQGGLLTGRQIRRTPWLFIGGVLLEA